MESHYLSAQGFWKMEALHLPQKAVGFALP